MSFAEDDQDLEQWINDLIDHSGAGASTPSVVSDHGKADHQEL